MSSFEYAKSFIDSDSYKLFIGGEWVDAIDGGTYKIVCPNNQEVLATCANANEKDVDRAVKAAWKAFPEWKKLGHLERGAVLAKLTDAVESCMDKIGWVECLESGKAPALYGAHTQLRYFSGIAATAEGIGNVVVDHQVSLGLREPFGVVGQISAWNGPFTMFCMKIGPALAAGNCIVYRPSSANPIAVLMLLKVIQDVLPPGVLNVVTGDSATCGQAILDHPDIKKISFTGSTETGMKVALASAKKLIPNTLELGGKSAHIFFDDCDMNKAMMGLFMGSYANVGQLCAAGSRVLVQESFYDKFVEAAVNMTKGCKVGPGWDSTCQVNSIINESQFNKVMGYIEKGKKEGAKLLIGGNRVTDGDLAKGWYVAPTLFEGNNSMTIAREEIFGPVSTIIPFKDEAEAIAIANDTQYGLAGGVYTQDVGRALRVARAMHTGNVWVNTYLPMMGGYPYGGWGISGYGKENHKLTYEAYTQLKHIVINQSETEML